MGALLSRKSDRIDFTALTRDDWESITRILERGRTGGPVDAFQPKGATQVQPHCPSRTSEMARHIKAARNERIRFLDPSLFGEPAWDILLAIFISTKEGYRMSVAELIDATGISMSTVLRWLRKLQEVHLLARIPNDLDKRSTFVELTAEGCERMEALLAALDKKAAAWRSA